MEHPPYKKGPSISDSVSLQKEFCCCCDCKGNDEVWLADCAKAIVEENMIVNEIIVTKLIIIIIRKILFFTVYIL